MSYAVQPSFRAAIGAVLSRVAGRLAVISVALVPAMVAPGAALASGNTWEGTWDTDFSAMTLAGDSNGFAGTYDWDDGRIRGSLADATSRLYVGTWDEAPSRAGPTDAGDVEFTLAADGRSFTGRWRYEGGSSWAGWNGTCVAGPCLLNSDAADPPWPPLPSALVTLASVSNGCGGGKAGTSARWGDTSAYLNTKNPFGKRYRVNFRMACNMHDAGYAGARIRDPFRRGRITDFFGWPQRKIDRRFLRDMRGICRRQIPASARGARSDCMDRGGTLSIGAKSRYNLVRRFGRRYYLKRPRIAGTWWSKGPSGASPWQLTQAGRLVEGTWASGEEMRSFRGIIVSRDQDSLIRGAVKTDARGAKTVGKAAMRFDPRKPNRLILSGPGFTSRLKRVR